jgi:hypothetical protein
VRVPRIFPYDFLTIANSFLSKRKVFANPKERGTCGPGKGRLLLDPITLSIKLKSVETASAIVHDYLVDIENVDGITSSEKPAPSGAGY